MSKKTILFGCSGFFGPVILERYPNIIAVGRTKPPSYIKNRFIKITTTKKLKKLDKIDFDKVIFLIGNSDHHYLNSRDVKIALEHNFKPFLDSMEYFQSRKLKTIITFSGGLIYNQKKLQIPVTEKCVIDGFQNNYIFSKYLLENIVKFFSKQTNIINVRLSNIYGPSLLKRPDLIQEIMHKVLIKKEKKIYVKSMKPKRDFIYTADAADAVIKLLNLNYSGNINLGSGELNSVYKVCSIISKLTGVKIEDKKEKVSGPMKFVYDINFLKKIINWKPKFSLEDGLKNTILKINEYKKSS